MTKKAKEAQGLGVAFVLANGGRLPAGVRAALKPRRTRAKDYTRQPELVPGARLRDDRKAVQTSLLRGLDEEE